MLKKIIATQGNDVIPTVLRVGLGVVMFAHGGQKALGLFGGYGFSGTMGFFTGMGMPWILAFLVIVAEFLGSIGLITGTLTRVAAFGISCVMLGAIFMVHWPVGFFMNWGGNQAGEGFEYHILALTLAVALMIRGGGKASVDSRLAGMLK